MIFAPKPFFLTLEYTEAELLATRYSFDTQIEYNKLFVFIFEQLRYCYKYFHSKFSLLHQHPFCKR